MATFVLVHGAWHGGWCWKKVAPLLRAAGHDVVAPTLTGLADRSHLLNRETGLDTHIEDIVGLLSYEDLTGALLVGHSYGGLVITGVAGRAPERIAHLVYLDAAVPEPGQSLFDVVFPDRRVAFNEQAKRKGEGWKIPPPAGPTLFGVSDELDLAWIRPKLTPQPLKSFQQPVPPAQQLDPRIARTYISCTVDQSQSLAAVAARIRAEWGWRYRELPTGHDAMVTMPEELAGLLLEAVS